jgi:hypothetical protein
MKIALIGMEKEDKEIFFDMLRTNLEHGYGQNSDYQQSIGVDISVKHLFDSDQNKEIAKLILWDICPKSFFRWVRPLFFNGAIGAIVLFSDPTKEKTEETISLLNELKCQEFPKYLLILRDYDKETPERKNNIKDLEKEAKSLGYIIKSFETHLENVNYEIYSEFQGYWKELRKFYETVVIEIFSKAVENIPGNTYQIEQFKEQYFKTLEHYDSSLKKMYEILESSGLEHDLRNIYIRLKEGLFTINLFSSACYYHYPSLETKYICMVPHEKEFIGWSNLEYLPNNFILSMAKAFYLLDGNYDPVVRKQFNEISRQKK